MGELVTDTQIELHVPSFEDAKKFYSALGYEVVWEKEPYERTGYMVMRRAKSILNFYCGNEHVSEHPYFEKFPADTPRGYGVEIILPVDDIETFYETVKDTFPESVVRELNHKHSKKDFRFVDVFGFYLRAVQRYDWVNGRDKDGNPN